MHNINGCCRWRSLVEIPGSSPPEVLLEGISFFGLFGVAQFLDWSELEFDWRLLSVGQLS